MIPRSGVRARLVAAPARIITIQIVRGRAVGVGIVARREHRPRDGIQDGRGPLRSGRSAARPDVPRADERHAGHGDVHRDGDLADANPAVFVGDRHAHRVRAGGHVGVRGRDGARWTGRTPDGGRRAVTPVDGIRPGRVVRPRIAEDRVERNGIAHRGRLTGAGVHNRCRVSNGRRGRGRGARRVARVGHGERDGIDTVVDVGMARLGADAGGAVAEAPGVGDRVSVRVR